MWNVRFRAAIFAWLFLFVAGAPHAQGLRQSPSSDAPGPPPNYDAAAAYAPATQASRSELSAATSRLLKPGTKVQRDERFGAPTFLWAAKGHPYAASRARAGARRPEEEAARFHLRRFAGAYEMDDLDVASATVRSIHNTGRGPIVVKLKQAIDGIEVFRDEISVAMDRDLDLVSLSGFLPGARGRAGRAKVAAFALDPAQAIVAAIRDLTGQAPAASSLRRGGSRGGYDLYELPPGALEANLLLLDASRLKRVYFHLPDRLEAGYYVELGIGRADSTEALRYGYVISAASGVVLFRNNHTVADSYSYRVWADATGLRAPFDGPQGTVGTPHPTGTLDGFQAPFVAPNLVTLQNIPFSRNDPWLPPAATETVGNNVDAYADVAAPDGFSAGDFRATITGAGVFDRSYSTMLQPQSSLGQQMAAVTQLFYTVNFFHDWYYDSGFDEQSGNAQNDNFGRGGIPGDSIRAEAQDFSGRNNANMFTPADGGRPVMQMFVFDGNAERAVLVTSPVAARLNVGTAVFGPQSFDFAGNLVLANPSTACTPLVNAAQAKGNIVLVDRGTCASGFSQKAATVLAAGATGMIVANNVAPGVLNMAPTAGFNDNIPSLMISLDDGNTLKTELASGAVNVTLHRPQALDRDGTIDNQIVAHEWGHYISNRLIGNGNGLGINMARGLGEGWGDFHALLLTVKAEDALVASNANFNGVYALAGYALGGLNPDATPNQAWYFGIRRVPYSTDFSKNALTFKHIAEGVPLPAGVPTAFGADGVGNSEVHNTGEIWATMLWECYAGLLRDTLGANPRLTFDQAQKRMKDYLVGAYLLTPLNPTLLEARNALLSAASHDPVDHQRFEHAFARRGAGVFAVAPDRNSPTNSPGLIEDFEEHSTTTVTSSPTLAVVGQPITVTAKVTDGATGSVQFSEGATQLGTVALASGTASLAYTAPTQGSHDIQALYLGDAQFLSSTALLSLFVIPPPDFSAAASPTSLTLAAGQSGTIIFTVAPVNFTQTVTFACGGLPDKATCSFAPASVTPDGVHPVNSTLTIRTTANSASAGQPSASNPGSPLSRLAGLGAFSLFSLGVVALRRPLRRSTAAFLFGLALALAACSGGGGGGGPGAGPAPSSNGTPPGAYNVSIVAAFGASNHSVPVSVTVQ